MRNKSMKIDILADELKNLISNPNNDFKQTLELIKSNFPNLDEDNLNKVNLLVHSLVENNEKENIEIVTTTPISFNTKTRRTYPVIEELISKATKHIVITGYAISEHFDEIMEKLNVKSKQGVMVELFINDYEKVKTHLDKIEHSNKNFFRVYKFIEKEEDKMASLHAKTVIIDREKALISSANLSYHGMVSNIEIGVLVESKEKAQQILDIYQALIKNKTFKLYHEETVLYK
ncbi:phospholipase D-like domain-containing protein [Acholeplasma laidlawii]|uniref:phospholipase D-like domain-containing protein n=1 Tax=Acholeplasma laidlawii TaxID=2148 RepID=UPI0021F77F88|nr:phospholipase D-like domain-containing protein [Acholeplasma laidlawii]